MFLEQKSWDQAGRRFFISLSESQREFENHNLKDLQDFNQTPKFKELKRKGGGEGERGNLKTSM